MRIFKCLKIRIKPILAQGSRMDAQKVSKVEQLKLCMYHLSVTSNGKGASSVFKFILVSISKHTNAWVGI